MNEMKNEVGARYRIFYGFLFLINDIVFLSFGCFLSYYLRFYTRIFGSQRIPTYTVDNKYVVYSLIFVGVIIAISFLIRLYDFASIYDDLVLVYYLKILVPPFLSVISIIIIGLLYRDFPFSKTWIAVLILICTILMFFSRYVIGIITKKIFIKLGTYDIKIPSGFSENLKAMKDLSRFRKKIMYGTSLLISDIIFLALAFYLSYYLRFHTGILAEINKTYIIEKNYILYSVIFILSAIFLFFLFNLYDRDKIYRGSGYYSKLLKAVSINIVVIILVGYVLNLFTFSRKWILLLYLFSFVLLYLSRFLIEAISQKIIKKLNIRSKTVIIGIGENAKRIEDSLRKYSLEGDIIIGHLDKKQRILKNKEYFKDFTVLGYLEDLKDIINKNNIQRVIISSPEYKYDEILEILENLKGLDVNTLIFPGFFEFSLKRLSVHEIGGVPLMQVSNIGFFGINLFLKNLIDYILGSILFLIFIPIYLVVALMIKLNSRGPIFFEQKRLTKDCKVFYMYKFRTMYIDAEDRLMEVMKYNEADGPLFKIKNDPRVTRIGCFLRRFSIDELPQIINVLKGELSLVGPRPPLESEVKKYDEWEMKRMNVKQGITGLWQISGRSDLSFEEMARLDLYYIQNWSIEMDIKIILKTIPAALFGKGAY